jgi:hypothetical protein
MNKKYQAIRFGWFRGKELQSTNKLVKAEKKKLLILDCGIYGRKKRVIVLL